MNTLTIIIQGGFIAAGLVFMLLTRKEYTQMKLTREKLEKVLEIAADYQSKFEDDQVKIKQLDADLTDCEAKVVDGADALEILDDQALSDKVDAVIAKDEEIKNPAPVVEETVA